MNLNNISIIVPLANSEEKFIFLLEDLLVLSFSGEILLAFSDIDHLNKHKSKIKLKFQQLRINLLITSKGRAKQMNYAAKQSKLEYLWFLHADTRFVFSRHDFETKLANVSNQYLYYFDLIFDNNVLPIKINEIGVLFRTRWLHLPFGDQGFLMSNQLFHKLNMYCTKASYGEDHLLIWQAHHRQVKVLPLKIKIKTSSRKYQKNGWALTTLKHCLLTWKQAAPELIKLIRK